MINYITRLLGQTDYVPANVPELIRLLKLRPSDQQKLQYELRDLVNAGQVERIKGNRYILPQEADLLPGRIRMNRQGKGFFMPDDSSAQGNSPSRRSCHRHRPPRRPRARAPRYCAHMV